MFCPRQSIITLITTFRTALLRRLIIFWIEVCEKKPKSIKLSLWKLTKNTNLPLGTGSSNSLICFAKFFDFAILFVFTANFEKFCFSAELQSKKLFWSFRPMKSWRASGSISAQKLSSRRIVKKASIKHWNKMKQRLFSTLRSLQHENPLVCI